LAKFYTRWQTTKFKYFKTPHCLKRRTRSTN